MTVKIEGIERIERHAHRFEDSYGFIDSDRDFYVVGGQDTVIQMTNGFNEFYQSDYDSIEDFLDAEVGTTLLKSFESRDEFDITITLK